MKKTLILLLLGSFSIQLNAMSDDGQRPIKKKTKASSLAEQKLSALNKQLIDGIQNNNMALVNDALEKGTDPNTNHKNSPILVHSIYNIDYTLHSEDIISLLINNPKTNLNATNNNGLTAIHAAAFIAYPDIIELLIEAGANINCEDVFKNSPLMHLFKHINNTPGVLNNVIDWMRYLKSVKMLANRVDINKQNLEGNTALMMAIITELSEPDTFQSSNIIPYLVEKCNASVTIKNNASETALDIARKFDNNEKIIDLLENKLKEIKELQQQIKNEILEITPLPEPLAKVISEYLEGSQPIIIKTI